VKWQQGSLFSLDLGFLVIGCRSQGTSAQLFWAVVQGLGFGHFGLSFQVELREAYGRGSPQQYTLDPPEQNARLSFADDTSGASASEDVVGTSLPSITLSVDPGEAHVEVRDRHAGGLTELLSRRRGPRLGARRAMPVLPCDERTTDGLAGDLNESDV
jgi:hypothetical protein